MIRERLELIGLRLLMIPYFIVSLVGTFIFIGIVFLGWVLFGFFCWLVYGDAMHWVPDIKYPLPSVMDFETFKDNVKERQKKFNEKYNKR